MLVYFYRYRKFGWDKIEIAVEAVEQSDGVQASYSEIVAIAVQSKKRLHLTRSKRSKDLLELQSGQRSIQAGLR